MESWLFVAVAPLLCSAVTPPNRAEVSPDPAEAETPIEIKLFGGRGVSLVPDGSRVKVADIGNTCEQDLRELVRV